MGFSWQPEKCGNCGRRLLLHDEVKPGRYARRYVHPRGERAVCGACARLLDDQQQLDVDESPEAA